jgi:hypothetical protein
MANAVIRLRGDDAAAWTAANPVLALREVGLELDTGQMKVGDGVASWTSLAYFGGGGAASWGSITGTLSAQTDLQSALNGKAASTHSHIIGDVTGLQAALDGKQAAGSYQPLATVLTNTTAAFTTAQETKLAGVASGATANATDSALRDRATHTGTQAAATITGAQLAHALCDLGNQGIGNRLNRNDHRDRHAALASRAKSGVNC